MSSGDVLHRLQRLFVEELELEVDADADLIDSGAMDSLTFVQLLVELEHEFGFRVDVAALDLEVFTSVSRIARFVAGGADAGA